MQMITSKVPDVNGTGLVGDVDLDSVWMEKGGVDRSLELAFSLTVQGSVSDVPDADKAVLATGVEPVAEVVEADTADVSRGYKE